MDDVFNDQPANEQVKGETQQTTEQQPTEGQQATQEGQQQEVQGAAPPAAGTERHVPLEALEAERRGRQDWKDRATRAEERLRLFEEQQQRSQQPQQQDPLLVMQQQIVNERFNVSEMVLRSQRQDVDEVVEVFKQAASQNPALLAQMHASRDPWRFAYDEGKRLKFAAEIGNDPEAYREKLKAEVLAEIQKSSQGAQAPAQAPLPQSLAGARSSGARGNTFTGPTPMENLFNN